MLCAGKVTAYERGAENLEEIPVGVWQGAFGNSYLERGSVAYKPKFPAKDPILLPIVIEMKSLVKALGRNSAASIPKGKVGTPGKEVKVKSVVKDLIREMIRDGRMESTLTQSAEFEIQAWAGTYLGLDEGNPPRGTLRDYLKEVLNESGG